MENTLDSGELRIEFKPTLAIIIPYHVPRFSGAYFRHDYILPAKVHVLLRSAQLVSIEY
jgi:hypothetical protein